MLSSLYIVVFVVVVCNHTSRKRLRLDGPEGEFLE